MSDKDNIVPIRRRHLPDKSNVGDVIQNEFFWLGFNLAQGILDEDTAETILQLQGEWDVPESVMESSAREVELGFEYAKHTQGSN